MSLALLAKVAGMSTAVSTTLGSFVYYSFKENLAKIESEDETIKELEEEKEELSQQLGYAKNPINFYFVCPNKQLSNHKVLEWNAKSFEADCSSPDNVKVTKQVTL